MRRIGILGGTFNPPHLGHLHMAQAALKEEGLDEILWIPNGDPPHKIPEVSAADRFHMTELAIIDEPGMIVSDVEIRRNSRSYMAETLEEVQASRPDASLTLICGEDMLAGLASWYRADDIFRLSDILVFPRKEKERAELFMPDLEQTVDFLRQKGARVTVAGAEIPAVSSTEIRRIAAESDRNRTESFVRSLEKLIPEKTAIYIMENELYLKNSLTIRKGLV